MEYVEPGVGVANCLGPPVCKYLKYHRKLNDYVRNFGRIRDEFNFKMEDIELQLKVDLLSPRGKIPKKGVENWLKDVKEMIAEAQNVENKVRNGRYLCRAWNEKLVDEKTREMKEFLDKAPNASEGLAMDGPSAGLPLPTSELVGEEAVRKEIRACLMQKESLEELDLRNLPKLSALIMKDEGIGSATTSTSAPSATFSHLKRIEVWSCSSMKTLLPHWLLPNLQNLEEIHVVVCWQLVEILGAATSEVEEKGSDALIKFHLPKLRKLELWGLRNLKSICSKSGVMVCDSLELIDVTSCDKLKRIPPFVPLVGNGQPFAYAPPSLTIRSWKEWWESLEWDDHSNFKNVLQPLWKEKRFEPFIV
ncbi:hypothetical protein GOBAR_DD27520 [Gossypium barbadense]|nr:hypothetical protein GOBAR_DD27520 [Gossypium barbadense]